MTNLEFAPLVFLISITAGYLGALTGLGGGVVVTPALTLLLGGIAVLLECKPLLILAAALACFHLGNAAMLASSPT